MLNYSNTHRKDPKTKSNALKCALTLLAIFGIFAILKNYHEEIGAGLAIAIRTVCFGIAAGVMATSEFFKPVFEVAGQYILWGIVFVCLWSLCVFSKIEKTCLKSTEQWQIIGLLANTVLFFYLILYLVYISYNESTYREYIPFYIFFYLGIIMSSVYLYSETAERQQNQKSI